MIFTGIDVGSSCTKVAILDKKKFLIGYDTQKTMFNFSKNAINCLNNSLLMANKKKSDIAKCFSTGYGRKNIDFADNTKSEIACHGQYAYSQYKRAVTIIDIGGQDNKIIKLDSNGNRKSFKMNLKCASGTGSFLEHVAQRLSIPLKDLNKLAKSASKIIKLGSMCTVFTETEVLEKLKQDESIDNIVKGLFYSVITKIKSMDILEDPIIMTGGVVEHNMYIADMLEQETKCKVFVPEKPQLAGAIGAALYAYESDNTIKQ